MLNKNEITNSLTAHFETVLSHLEKSSQAELQSLTTINKDVEKLKHLLEEINSIVLPDEQNISLDLSEHNVKQKTLKQTKTVGNLNININSSNNVSGKTSSRREKSIGTERNNKSITDEQTNKKTYPKTPKKSIKEANSSALNTTSNTTTNSARQPGKSLTRTTTSSRLKTVTKTPIKSNPEIKNKNEENVPSMKKNMTVKNFNVGKNSSKNDLQRSMTKSDLLKTKEGTKNKTVIEKPSEKTKPTTSDFIVGGDSTILITSPDQIIEKEVKVEPPKIVPPQIQTPLIENKISQPVITPPVKKEKINYFYQLANINKLTYIHKYLNKTDLIRIFPAGVTPGRLSLQILFENAKKECEESESKLNNFKLRSTDLTIPTEEYAPFVMSRGANRAIELLNENIYNKIFAAGYSPPEDVKLIYKIFFFFIKREDIAGISDSAEFWKACSEFVNKEGNSKTGTLISGLTKNFDFSKFNVYRITKLVEKHLHKIAPAHFSKICATTGLFIFLIKDTLEYAGIICQDKKTPTGRIYENLTFAADFEKEKGKRLTNLLNEFYKLS